MLCYLLLLLISSVISTKFLAIAKNADRELFLSHIYLRNNYTIRNVHDVSKLGYGISATFNGSIIWIITMDKNSETYHVHNINMTGHVGNNKVTVNNSILIHIEQDYDKLFAIRLGDSTHNYTLVQLDYINNKMSTRYDFGSKVDFIRAAAIDKVRHIYYACTSDLKHVMIHAINTETFQLVSVYGPLSKQVHYIWFLLNDAIRLYAIIFNADRKCNELVIINIMSGEIENTFIYNEFVTVHSSTLSNGIIYSIMSDWYGYYFVTTNLNTQGYSYIRITDRLLPVGMWVM